MAYNQDLDAGGPAENTQPQQPAQPSQTAPTYTYVYTDPDGTQVYKGNDGNLYTYANSGPYGFEYVPYSQKPTTTDTSTPPPPTPSPSPSPSPTNTAPSGPAPSFSAPGYTPPPAFSYADFVAPNPEDLNNDPFYKSTLANEQGAIERSAAARGTLHTGGTIDDLLRNTKDINSSFYNDLYGRKVNEYSMGRRNALDTYNVNYGTQYQDPYKIQYQGSQDAFNSQIHNYDVNRQYGWMANLFDYQKDQDLWDRKYRLLSL